MVNWASAAEIAKDGAVFQRIIFVFLGIILWELFTTWDFEWSLITERRKFRWPLGGSDLRVFSVLNEYDSLLLLMPILHPSGHRSTDHLNYDHLSSSVNCAALYTCISGAGNMTILCASTSLMLRTIALWERRNTMVIPLGILCLTHWIVLFRTMFIVRATWNDSVGACVVTQTDPGLLNVTYFLTMGFDFVIMLATATALLKKHTARTDLWKLLFRDGLVYFIVAFTSNCVPAVLNILNLNETMNVIGTVPATAISAIASCRAVMRLLEFNLGSICVPSSLTGITNSNPQRHNAGQFTPSNKFGRQEVHVTTEHIMMSDFPKMDLQSRGDAVINFETESCEYTPTA